MLELVISDDLTPPLQCPHCRRVFVRCSLAVSAAGATCPSCSGRFRVQALRPGCVSIPAGLSVVDRGAVWRVGISSRSPNAALGSLISGIALAGGIAFDLTHGASVVGESVGGSFIPDLSRMLVPVSIAAGLGLLASAAYWMWGVYTVSVEGGSGAVFKGPGRIGARQPFPLSAINGVCLARVQSEDQRGKPGEKHVIRLGGVDFYLEFGHDLPAEQRVFIALFLLQKRSDLLPLA